MDFKEYLIWLLDNIRIKLNTFIKIISHFIPEISITLGLFFIMRTTFCINKVAGFYLTGGILLLMGLFFAKDRR